MEGFWVGENCWLDFKKIEFYEAFEGNNLHVWYMMNISGKFGLNLSYPSKQKLCGRQTDVFFTQVAAAEFGSQKTGMCFFQHPVFFGFILSKREMVSILTHASFLRLPDFSPQSWIVGVSQALIMLRASLKQLFFVRKKKGIWVIVPQKNTLTLHAWKRHHVNLTFFKQSPYRTTTIKQQKKSLPVPSIFKGP